MNVSHLKKIRNDVITHLHRAFLMSSLPNEERQRAPQEIESTRMAEHRGRLARRIDSDRSLPAAGVKGIHE